MTRVIRTLRTLRTKAEETDIKLITRSTSDQCVKRIKEDIFFGSDANRGVAASAKMDMIIAGDGHTHIQHEDSLSSSAKNWNVNNTDCNIIMTNPPFGTAEGDSLASDDKKQYNVNSTKGQYLFLQKMIDCTVAGGEICTVIDEGVLNTGGGQKLREYILQNCYVRAIVRRLWILIQLKLQGAKVRLQIVTLMKMMDMHLL